MKDAIIAFGWVTAKEYARAERMKGCNPSRCDGGIYLCAWCLVQYNEAEYLSALLHRPAMSEED